MRPESSIPLTLPEHRDLGRELKLTAARLHELGQLVSTVYGPNNHAAFTFTKVLEAMDRLRSDLETQAGQDLPGHVVDGIYR